MPLVKSSVPSQAQQHLTAVVQMLKMAAFIYEETTPKSKQTITLERVLSRCEVDPFKDESEILQYVNENHHQRRQLGQGHEPFRFNVWHSSVMFAHDLHPGMMISLAMRLGDFHLDAATIGPDCKLGDNVFMSFVYGALSEGVAPTVATKIYSHEQDYASVLELLKRVDQAKLAPRPVAFSNALKVLERVLTA